MIPMVVTSMAQQNRRPSFGANENVLHFARSSAPSCGATALSLVYQAADVLSDIEDHARETEARAQAMCKAAAERLKHAETRIEAEAKSLLKPVANSKMPQEPPTQAELCITAAEDKAIAAEVRAQIAEAEAREAKQALALVEEAIRGRLLCANPETIGKLSAVA